MLVITLASRTEVQPALSRLPDRLSNRAFWDLIRSMSERGGYFLLANWASNERETGALVTMLHGFPSRRAYIGVGPEQNFSYIAALNPSIAFIVDIRRQAMLQQLMYKSMFELSPDRGQFLSMLFARPRPAIDSLAPAASLWNAVLAFPPDSSIHRRYRLLLIQHLKANRALPLSDEDVAGIQRIYDTFVELGPAISTSGVRTTGRAFVVTTTRSLDRNMEPQGFLVTHEAYAAVREMHMRNLIIPIVGDFAGSSAIAAIGRYLRANNSVIGAFYVSNVEQYLFGSGKQMRFYENAALLPIDSTSVFIRPAGLDPVSPEKALCPMQQFLELAMAGKVLDWSAAISCKT